MDEFDGFEMYRPHGECAIPGCNHVATEVWQLYKGQQRFEFRCDCCVILGRLERAKWYRDQIPALETDYEVGRVKCGARNFDENCICDCPDNQDRHVIAEHPKEKP